MPNPMTPGQFAQQIIVNFAIEVVKNYQANIAATMARQGAILQVDQVIASSPIVVAAS
jgi:hypothetical protein